MHNVRTGASGATGFTGATGRTGSTGDLSPAGTVRQEAPRLFQPMPKRRRTRLLLCDAKAYIYAIGLITCNLLAQGPLARPVSRAQPAAPEALEPQATQVTCSQNY